MGIRGKTRETGNAEEMTGSEFGTEAANGREAVVRCDGHERRQW